MILAMTLVLRRLIVLVPALGLTATSGGAQELTAEACTTVRAAVLPSEDDERWRSIPWHDTLGTAVLEADEQQRPVLLWAMNGHPLGCT